MVVNKFYDLLRAQMVKSLPAVQETWVQSLGWEDPLEKEMATHSRILAWKIPWTEEPCRLQSMGSQRINLTERLHYSHYKVNFTILGDSFKRIKDHIYLPLIPDYLGFPDSSVGKESACSTGDLGSIPGLGRSPGKENGYQLQYSCLENSVDGGAWWANVHAFVKESNTAE